MLWFNKTLRNKLLKRLKMKMSMMMKVIVVIAKRNLIDVIINIKTFYSETLLNAFNFNLNYSK